MDQNSAEQPMFILDEGSQRITDGDAQSYNSRAAQAMANAVQSTLGPKGMDKRLIDAVGNFTITNDGVTILRKMDIENPVANLVVEVASTQEREAGDGTTTAVTVTGDLLENAEELIEKGVHPATIVRGFNRANDRARDELDDIANAADGESIRTQIAQTSMTGRTAETHQERLSDLLVDAVDAVTIETDDGDMFADVEYIRFETQDGRPISRSELLEGAVLDADVLHENMPMSVDDARLLLVDTPIGIEELAVETQLDVDDVAEIQDYVDKERSQVRDQVDRILTGDVDVVLCQKGIEPAAAQLLAKAGVVGVQQVSKEDISFIKNVLDATIVSDPDEITDDIVGHGDIWRDFDEEAYYIRSHAEGGHGVTLLLRGSTKQVVDEIERSAEDTMDILALSVNDRRILPGGGATEVELAGRLRDYADSVSGREQLAVEVFADALETVPRTLARNSGLDPIDSLIDLRTAHERGDVSAGLDVFTGGVVDTVESGVVEPVHAKKQVLDSATEAANLVLRIDAIISAGDLSEILGQDEELREGGDPSDEISGGTGRPV